MMRFKKTHHLRILELEVVLCQVLLMREDDSMDKLNNKMNAGNATSKLYISSEVKFYTITEIMKMTGWSENIVQKLFNDPKFPSSNFGRKKVVEAHALIDYFSKKHEKEYERYWQKEAI